MPRCVRAAMCQALLLTLPEAAQKCESLADSPAAIGHLDGDTALSRHTWTAALQAAGAVCRAVDEVVCGTVRLPQHRRESG